MNFFKPCSLAVCVCVYIVYVYSFSLTHYFVYAVSGLRCRFNKLEVYNTYRYICRVQIGSKKSAKNKKWAVWKQALRHVTHTLSRVLRNGSVGRAILDQNSWTRNIFCENIFSQMYLSSTYLSKHKKNLTCVTKKSHTTTSLIGLSPAPGLKKIHQTKHLVAFVVSTRYLF